MGCTYIILFLLYILVRLGYIGCRIVPQGSITESLGHAGLGNLKEVRHMKKRGFLYISTSSENNNYSH